jgi:GT2 family glycosyltransferase
MAETSNSDPLVSFVIATINRPDDLKEAIESALEQEYRPIEIIVVSNSDESESTLFEHGGQFSDDPIKYLHFSERMRAPKAKNIAFENALGEFIVLMDDDAVLVDTEATDQIVSLFERHDDVGALAFQSQSYYTGEPRLFEIPSPPDFELPPVKQMRVSTFCGVGTALRRSVVTDLGGFPDDFIYGFEEQDLSIRILDKKYDILYVPSIIVHHKKSPEGRLTEDRTKMHQIENRIRIAVRSLPWRYVLFTALIWSIYGLLTFRFRLDPLCQIYSRLYNEKDSLLAERSVTDDETISLLKTRSTLLFAWWYGPHPRRLLDNPDRFNWN